MSTRKKQKIAEVKDLHKGTARDFESGAQNFLDGLRAGHFGRLTSGVLCTENTDGVVDVFVWGGAGHLRTIGLLTLGQTLVTNEAAAHQVDE